MKRNKVVLVTVLEVVDTTVTLELYNGSKIVRPLSHFTTFICRGNSIERGVSLYTNL